ncbi:amidase [Candidatus Poriferisodalis sp.]|uniref:amidase n=1 Tax=Candidatus Poriferisodalis sp. TaxID=3101277 RepID=UPI003B029F21
MNSGTHDDLGICGMTATQMAAMLANGAISARELLAAHLARIEQVNPALNAIVTLTPELAAARATAADEAHARGESLGLLHGLPVAHKDLAMTAGVRTTMGSPLFADFVPDADALVVERQRAAGAVMVGKTNTPEFGAGSHTFNPVFGITRNPYDRSKTCGGSSGGAATALAARMLPLCDGSDLGGSLRNPAAFCNVVGFRPSPGRVPSTTSPDAWFPLAVDGPMARTVADAAFYLQALAGPHDRSPVSIQESPTAFADALERDVQGVRVAWSPDAGGLPVDPAVRAATAHVPDALTDLGCEVVEAWPDLTDAPQIFHARRAWAFAVGFGPLLEAHRDAAHRGEMKESVVWNIRRGLAMSMADYGDACRRHTQLFARVHEFMSSDGDGFEFLACPTTQVPPFDVDLEYPTQIEGVEFETYIDWMRSCSDITVTTHPAISVPAGFTADGLPVGLQLVGRHRADRSVLELAHAWETATRHVDVLPPLS